MKFNKTKIAFVKAAIMTTSFFVGGIISDLARKHPMDLGKDIFVAVLEGAYFYALLHPDLIHSLLLGKPESTKTIDMKTEEQRYNSQLHEMTRELKKDADHWHYGLMAEYMACAAEATKEPHTLRCIADAIAGMYNCGAGLKAPNIDKHCQWKKYADSLSLW